MPAKAAKKTATKHATVSVSGGKVVAHPAPQRALRSVRVGSVTVQILEASPAETRRNVAHSRAALRRVSGVLAKPGVQLKLAPSIPRYHADPKVAGRLVRLWNGKRQVGVFELGAFKPLR